MLSYRFMVMAMEGNRSGTDSLNPSDFLIPPQADNRFAVAPLDMDMEMHMVGVMFAPTDKLTLMAMVNYTELTMSHLVAAPLPMVGGTRFTTRSSGFGDASISALYEFWTSADRNHSWIVNLGVALPTGSIDETGFLPVPPNNPGIRTLPYPMQLGSGTPALMPGITYRGFSDQLSWGSQVKANLQLGQNDQDYSLGDRFEWTGWIARPISGSFGVSARLNYRIWGNIQGQDPRIALRPMPMAPFRSVPTAQPDLRRGQQLDVLAGMNFQFKKDGFLRGHRLAAEFALPVHRDLEGPQLETDWSLTLGWQKAF